MCIRDRHVEVPALGPAELLQSPPGEGTAAVQARCRAARALALARQGKDNHALQGREIDQHTQLAPEAGTFLRNAAARLGWSARATHRTLKIARTIADLAGTSAVAVSHVAEAAQYRRALQAGATWMFSRNFGVGLGYSHFAARFDVERPNYNGRVKLGYGGLQAFLTGTF